MTWILLDHRFLLHRPQHPHPERPERLVAIEDALKESEVFNRFTPLKPHVATDEELMLAHSESHLNIVKAASESAPTMLDPDTYVSKGSLEAARVAAGGLVAAVSTVCSADDPNEAQALCLVRPPGHHATYDRPMGFCLFNNVAIGARFALRNLNLDRVAIVDLDVHHGNGTQDIFWGDPSVLFASLHQMPLYPGSGYPDERGAGDSGHILNIPLESGSGDSEYLGLFHERVVPAIEAHRPELILVSLGLDGLDDDPLATLALTQNAFVEAIGTLMDLAGELCHGRLIITLEGGYDLDAISATIVAISQKLLR